MTISLDVLWGGLIALLGFIFVVFGFLWKLSVGSDKKINRVYQRFDENKKEVKENFVEKDRCQLINEHNKENFARIEKNIQDGFSSVNNQIDCLIKKIMDWKKENGGR